MRRLGVIGGLGPIATAYFYELVIRMTEAASDQEHLDMLIYSKPSIPDRTEYILGKSKANPLKPMIEVGKALENMGADHIAIPCITAHYFHDELTKGVKVPIIHIVKETVQHLYEHGIRCVGIMATEGTIHSRLFQEELEAWNIKAIIPSKERQKDISNIIYNNVKANLPVDFERFETVTSELREKGAKIIILGCTELSLIKRDYPIGPGFIDAMEVLAMRSILLCEAKLKEEYKSLITNKEYGRV